MIFLSLLFLSRFSAPAWAENGPDAEAPWFRKVVVGLFLHDRGPGSDRHEHGVDPNLELQWNPPEWQVWRWIGSPSPIVGATPNFRGDTSVWYGGIAYEFSLSSRVTDGLTYNLTKTLFVSGGLSAALHNGPLHKDPVGCKERSDCGFGHRVLPRLNIELGSYFRPGHGVSFFYDHMSHKHVLPGENEGIDHIGVRYHYNFNRPAS